MNTFNSSPYFELAKYTFAAFAGANAAILLAKGAKHLISEGSAEARARLEARVNQVKVEPTDVVQDNQPEA